MSCLLRDLGGVGNPFGVMAVIMLVQKDDEVIIIAIMR
jgi:hypothetical protein